MASGLCSGLPILYESLADYTEAFMPMFVAYVTMHADPAIWDGLSLGDTP